MPLRVPMLIESLDKLGLVLKKHEEKKKLEAEISEMYQNGQNITKIIEKIKISNLSNADKNQLKKQWIEKIFLMDNLKPYEKLENIYQIELSKNNIEQKQKPFTHLHLIKRLITQIDDKINLPQNRQTNNFASLHNAIQQAISKGKSSQKLLKLKMQYSREMSTLRKELQNIVNNKSRPNKRIDNIRNIVDKANLSEKIKTNLKEEFTTEVKKAQGKA